MAQCCERSHSLSVIIGCSRSTKQTNSSTPADSASAMPLASSAPAVLVLKLARTAMPAGQGAEGRRGAVRAVRLAGCLATWGRLASKQQAASYGKVAHALNGKRW